MNILTKTHLIDHNVRQILERFIDEYCDDGELLQPTLDAQVWNNLEGFGRIVYEHLGEYYGDIDEAHEATKGA